MHYQYLQARQLSGPADVPIRNIPGLRGENLLREMVEGMLKFNDVERWDIDRVIAALEQINKMP